jgi:prepilin signal peptidase PulO-like enzyme (type II secretory pathway)
MFVAHCILWAGLIAVTVMDLESYTLDITLTWIVLLTGLVGHTLWTPAESVQPATWIRPGPLAAAIAVAGCLGLILGMWIFLRAPPPDEQEAAPDVPGAADRQGLPAGSHANGPAAPAPPPPPPGRRLWPIIATLVVIGLLALFVVRLATMRPDPPLSLQYGVHPRSSDFAYFDRPPAPDDDWKRLLVVAGVLFVGLSLVASHPHVEADEDIVESIETESVSARRVALEELVLLSPAMLLILAVILLFRFIPGLPERALAVLHWTPWGDWQPLLGFSTALFGAFVGVALGWGTRIAATLAFGKEGLGMGDVHILAAAGAVAGWPAVVLGFFLAAPIALLALPVIRLRRQSMMVPYGPWLAFGFFLAAIFQERILWFLNVRRLLE